MCKKINWFKLIKTNLIFQKVKTKGKNINIYL